MGLGSPTIADHGNCDNSTAGDPIHCEKGTSATDAITIDVDGIDIDTSAESASGHGVYAIHEGSGDIDLDISGTTIDLTKTPSMIDTTGRHADAILGQHTGTTGAITITVEDAQITTTGAGARGIHGQNRAIGKMEINLGPGVVINTQGDDAIGVQLNQQNADASASHVILTADKVTVTTRGARAHGLFASRETGLGDVRMTIDDSTITTQHMGDDSIGIYAYKHADEGNGKINVDITGGSTTTKGSLAHGIHSYHQEGRMDGDVTGDITINLLGHAVRTEGTAMSTRIPGATYSYGIYAVHQNSGNTGINLGKGSSVTTLGPSSHGIVAYHFGTADTRTIDITVSGPVTVSGQDAQGVRVGAVRNGAPERFATLDAQGYRDQTVTVDSSISSQGPGIYLVNGGKVIIGPKGRVRSDSGIAILATGTVPEDSSDPSNIVAAIPPKLRVDLNLGGRQVAQVLGDNWIINDGGGTTIVVNGVKLHDGTTGVVPGVSAPNGAHDVRIRAEGVRVLDRTDPDPANWALSDLAENVIADRDFSAADFAEEEVQMPPMFVEEYAPRTALYEALPDVLLRLQHRDSIRPPLSRPGRPVWIRMTGRAGSQNFDRSTVGTGYDMDYVEVEAGKHFLLDNGLDAWAALHYVTGTADVSSTVKGGDIDVRGWGLSLELCHGCDSGNWYTSGRLALAHYDLNLSSDERGRLRSGVDATAWGLRLETGRRLQWGRIQLIPRVRLDYADVSVNRFTDAVGARVSHSGVDRFAVALGVMAESVAPAAEGELSLWGSLDIEHRLDDVQTVTRVSGERLTVRSETDSLLLGMGGTWRWDGLEIHAWLSARETLDSGGEEYGFTLGFDLQF